MLTCIISVASEISSILDCVSCEKLEIERISESTESSSMLPVVQSSNKHSAGKADPESFGFGPDASFTSSITP
jgi:hypothetical protein